MISPDRGKQKRGRLEKRKAPSACGEVPGAGGSEEEAGRSITAVAVISKTERQKGRAAATRHR